MRRKKYKPKLRFYIIILVIIAVLGFILNIENENNKKTNQGKKEIIKAEINKEKIEKDGIIEKKNILFFDDENLYAVYGEKFTLKIPLYIYISKSKKLENLIAKKKYKEVLNELNKILPERLEEFVKISKGNIEKPLNKKEIMIPILKSKEKKYIDTYEVAMLFMNRINEKNIVNNNGIIDILNANGIGGYAGKVGKKLARNLGYKYNAANYEKRTDYTYIINKKLTKFQLEQIVEQMPEKNIKIKKEIGVSTLADVILILGKDRGNLTYILIEKYNKLDYKNFETLQKNGYRNLHRTKSKQKIVENKIVYNKEDYYTAYKISKKLGINLLEENDKLKNKIEIKIGGEKND